MEAVIFSKEQFDELNKRLSEILNKLPSKEQNPDTIIENSDFAEMMKVSKRTIQAWRDEGKIAFSQVGVKIYYRWGDIESFLKLHHNKAFAANYKPTIGK